MMVSASFQPEVLPRALTRPPWEGDLLGGHDMRTPQSLYAIAARMQRTDRAICDQLLHLIWLVNFPLSTTCPLLAYSVMFSVSEAPLS
jgi:hypothetical protein